jgi:hypothetical protein
MVKLLESLESSEGQENLPEVLAQEIVASRAIPSQDPRRAVDRVEGRGPRRRSRIVGLICYQSIP